MPTQERALIFNADMVRAILEGRKTQTRRAPVERYRNWKVGEMIWVRERIDNGLQACNFYYHADNKGVGNHIYKRICDYGWTYKKIIPSIHMPKWAARIFLEITGLREERVQDITASDILEEGVVARNYPDLAMPKEHLQWLWERFCTLWDSINANRHKGIYSWDKNPKVKVIEFKRVQEYPGSGS